MVIFVVNLWFLGFFGGSGRFCGSLGLFLFFLLVFLFIFSGSWWFLVVLGGSLWLLMFFMLLGGSWWFLMILGCFGWLLVVFGVFFGLILIHCYSWRFLVVLYGSL